jgi:hypothetical protein
MRQEVRAGGHEGRGGGFRDLLHDATRMLKSGKLKLRLPRNEPRVPSGLFQCYRSLTKKPDTAGVVSDARCRGEVLAARCRGRGVGAGVLVGGAV